MPATYKIYVRVTVPVRSTGQLTQTMKDHITGLLNADGIPTYFRNKGWTWVDTALNIEYVETIVS
jgi:hypothetical protein